MSSTDSTLDAYNPPRRRGLLGFTALVLLGVCLAAFAIVWKDGPILSSYPDDWIRWLKAYKSAGGLLALGVVITFIGLVGFVLRLFSGVSTPAPKVRIEKRQKSTRQPAPAMAVPATYAQDDSHLNIPASETLTQRGNLKFDADRLSAEEAAAVASQPLKAHVSDEQHPLFAEPPAVEIRSLEPAIFHDNASDSFLSQNPVASAPVAPEAVPAFDANDALSEAHGLVINRTEPSNVVPIRPDIMPQAALAPAHDPVEAALLADSAVAPRPAPQSDINAVISSAMRFIDSAPEAPTTTAPAPQPSADAEIRQAVSTALSVWPDSTRAVATDELTARLTKLYHDPSPDSARAFHLIATGDLNAGANALQNQADALVQAGFPGDAAELWRIIGALNMGRDDAKAMAAYEKVSALDPADANIHLYLARRYQMAGDTARQPAVLARALAVISDPSLRAELLQPYADLKLKAGDAMAAGDAFEELARLNETTANLRPDDIAARSAYGISLARLAQAREMHGAFNQAGPLYSKAHKVFADLSAMKPEHPGLRAMADNALKDARRFGA